MFIEEGRKRRPTVVRICPLLSHQVRHSSCHVWGIQAYEIGRKMFSETFSLSVISLNLMALFLPVNLDISRK